MGYPKEVYDKVWQTLAQRKQDNGELAAAHRREIQTAVPEIARIEKEMIRTANSVAKTVVMNPGEASKRIESLKRESLELQRQRAELLVQAGYPPGYLEPRYTCDKCRDTGYQGTQMCDCFRDLLRSEAASHLSRMTNVGASRFQDFDLRYYPDSAADASGVVPRQRMAQILEYCRGYVASFSADQESLLLIGNTGLGKTHLSLAMAAELVEAGHGVLYSPVQKLIDQLESDKFSYDSARKERYAYHMEQILGADLLILDDLGTEFATQFTLSALYNIVNTRLVEGRPTIINTNLDLPQIEERYNPRMFSRLVGSYKALKFYGKDIRFLKRQMV